MPIVFDEIASEITPERGTADSEPTAAPGASEGVTLELVMRELEVARERSLRLIAD